jgi:hypothetical protein
MSKNPTKKEPVETADDLEEVIEYVMHRAQVVLEGVSPYSQSRFHDTPKEQQEKPDDHEKRTWQNRVHARADGTIFIPPMSLKLGLDAASRYQGRIPGMGMSHYSKRFLSGVLVTDEITLMTGGKEATLDSFKGEWLHLNSDGVRGSGKRVKRCMPRLDPPWIAIASVYVLDSIITEQVMTKALNDAGRFVGLGRFRPEKGGYYGRFKLQSIEWAQA